MLFAWSRLVLPKDGCDCCTLFCSLQECWLPLFALFDCHSNLEILCFLQKAKLNNISSACFVIFYGRTALSIALDVYFENVCVC